MHNGLFIGFDLDGTLIHSRNAIYECLKFTLPKYVNDDIDEIIDTIFPLTMDQFPNHIKFKDQNSFNKFNIDFKETFDKTYYKSITLKKYCLDILKETQSLFGKENVFILTNRREESTKQVCHYLQIEKILDSNRIFCTKSKRLDNPKSESLAMVINQLSLQNKKGFYVGDSETDILSAIDNGISPIYLSDQLDYSIIKNYKLLENKSYFKELLSLWQFLKK